MGELSYKGFSGTVIASVEDDCLHGSVLFINDLITYEGQTIAELRQAFENAVDRYLDYCKKAGKEPNKPYSGSFNVRPGPELHKAMATKAVKAQLSLNEAVKEAFKCYLASEESQVVNHHYHETHVHVLESQGQEQIRDWTSGGVAWQQRKH